MPRRNAECANAVGRGRRSHPPAAPQTQVPQTRDAVDRPLLCWPHGRGATALTDVYLYQLIDITTHVTAEAEELRMSLYTR
jgi:hypothetical protein